MEQRAVLFEPRTRPAGRRDVQCGIRLSTAERKVLKAMARERGLTLSDLVREALAETLLPGAGEQTAERP